MDAELLNVDFWHWLILGLILVLTEFFAWSIYFLWIGISAIIVGVVVYFVPSVSWDIQLVIFATLSIILFYSSKKLIKR
jgi:hypothetical protein